MARHPCGICGVHVRESDEAIQCDGKCSLWHHRECLGMTLSVYVKLSKGQEDWVCRKCRKLKKIKQEVEASRRRRQKSPEDMGKTKMECKKLDFLNDTQKCVFCHTSDIDEMRYGPIYTHKNIITHYYCLLLSSNMEQNGRDCDGILGFLPGDITKEVKRGVRLYCTYCRVGGTTLGCAIARCKVVFHLPCGLRNGTLHQFYGEFKSYCAKHRPVQKISENILAESSKGVVCGICYEKVVPRPIHDTLWAPCCQKNAFFHRDCVQKLATSAGYFFKCPLCNNVETFTQSMKEFGIYIPEQDASWESVPNAYQDLLVRHDTCDSTRCICPSGRKTNVSGTRWELILCKMCGSKGIHIGCGRLKWKSPEFECDICNSTVSREDSPGEEVNNTGHTRNYNGNGNRHRLSGTPAGEQEPTVSAERIVYDSSDSNDSSLVTISNRRKLVKSPSLEYRSKTPPLSSRIPKKERSDRTENKPTSNPLGINETYQKPNKSIIIDDSDDDIEYVGESTINSSCLKTLHGGTIPVVQINSSSSQKRLRVEGDVKVKPLEIVDFTLQVQGPTKRPKAVSPPRIKEVLINNPINQPSTSVTPAPVYTVPSTSFALPSDMGRFVQVDPATMRLEDLPPGTLLYRSLQTVSTTPQQQQQLLHSQPQPMPSSLPNIPLQQLGSTSNADAQHSDLGEHGARGGHYHSPLHPSHSIQKDVPSRSLKHHSAGRRRRRPLKCDSNRLNLKVALSPLKFRMANSGHIEILLPRRKLGFALSKRKVAPLPSRPIKKLKPTSKSVKNISLCKKNTKDKKKSTNLNKNLNPEITKSQNIVPLENSKKLSIEDYFCPIAKGRLNIIKTKSSTSKSRKRKITEENKEINIKKKCKTLSSTLPTNKTNHSTSKKIKIPFEDWKYKKIDFFLQNGKLSPKSQPKEDCSKTEIVEEILNENEKSQVLLEADSDTILKNYLLGANHKNVNDLKECIIDEKLIDSVNKDNSSVSVDVIMETDLSKEDSSTCVESQLKEQDVFTKFTTSEDLFFRASQDKLLVENENLMENDVSFNNKIILSCGVKGQDKDEMGFMEPKPSEDLLNNETLYELSVDVNKITEQNLLLNKHETGIVIESQQDKIDDISLKTNNLEGCHTDKQFIKTTTKKSFSLFPRIKFAIQTSKSKKGPKKAPKKPETQTEPSINRDSGIKKYEIRQYFTSEDLNGREISSFKNTEDVLQMGGDEVKQSPQKRPLLELQLNVISNF